MEGGGGIEGEIEPSENENRKKFESFLDQKSDEEKKMFSNESWTISDQGTFSSMLSLL